MGNQVHEDFTAVNLQPLNGIRNFEQGQASKMRSNPRYFSGIKRILPQFAVSLWKSVFVEYSLATRPITTRIRRRQSPKRSVCGHPAEGTATKLPKPSLRSKLPKPPNTPGRGNCFFASIVDSDLTWAASSKELSCLGIVNFRHETPILYPKPTSQRLGSKVGSSILIGSAHRMPHRVQLR